MKTPAKILLAKDYLNDAEALSLLEQLCELPAIPLEDFRDLVVSRNVYFYFEGSRLFKIKDLFKLPGLPFESEDGTRVLIPASQMIRGTSQSLRVETFFPGYHHERKGIQFVFGDALFYPQQFEAVSDSGEIVSLTIGPEEAGVLPESTPVQFKPADIQELADTINGKEQDAEIELLRRTVSEIPHLRSRLSQAEQNSEFLQAWKDRNGPEIDLLRQHLKEAKEACAAVQEENKRLNLRIAELEAENTSENPKDSALILIARALELYQKERPERNTQANFVLALRQGNEGLRGLSERTVNQHLADAKKVIDQERKK